MQALRDLTFDGDLMKINQVGGSYGYQKNDNFRS